MNFFFKKKGLGLNNWRTQNCCWWAQVDNWVVHSIVRNKLHLILGLQKNNRHRSMNIGRGKLERKALQNRGSAILTSVTANFSPKQIPGPQPKGKKRGIVPHCCFRYPLSVLHSSASSPSSSFSQWTQNTRLIVISEAVHGFIHGLSMQWRELLQITNKQRVIITLEALLP